MEHILSQARSLRKLLHIYPELSGKEFHTREIIREVMNSYGPDDIIEMIAGTGIAFIFKGKKAGKTILFRADMDAIPIKENNAFLHVSRNAGAAHACGHDGHCAILAGVGALLHESPPAKGTYILLFQPAEETGQGAVNVLSDPVISRFRPDYVFAIHNLPGFKKNSVVIRKGVFASASKGIIIKLKGSPAHAAYPETGNSPALAMAGLIRELSQINCPDVFSGFVMLTIVHARLGEPAFGIAPSEAVIMLTLRSTENEDMLLLVSKVTETVGKSSNDTGLLYEITATDEFPATVNDSGAVDIIEDVALNKGFKVNHPDIPFRWSEDFGQFTARYKGALFGIGAGEECSPLHSYNYDFPDDIIETGIKMFYGICEQFAKEK